MNPKLEEYLLNKFPKLYKHDVECPFNEWKFECNDGWFRPLLWLSNYLQNYIDSKNTWAEKYPNDYKSVEQIRVVQVKEKFSTLRYYVEGGDERTSEVISFVEYMCGNFCEYTGEIDDVGYSNRGWMKRFHKSLTKNHANFNPVDDSELLAILEEIKK
jgi:hypothetical protein